MLINKRIRIARIIRGLSQWDLSRKTGIPNYRLSLIENGHGKASREEVQAICLALKVPDELLTEKSVLFRVKGRSVELVDPTDLTSERTRSEGDS